MKIDSNNKPYHLCFETLASDLRIKIIDELKKEALSVEDLAKRVKTERSTVSHSLKMLRDCSYVDVEHRGKERFYSLKSGSFETIHSNAKNNSIFQVIDQHIECFCNNDCKKIKVRA